MTDHASQTPTATERVHRDRDTASSTTWLFVPADRPDRFEKATESKADQLIIDLEDSVASAAKAHARETTARWLASGGAAWVRVNGVETPWHDDDLRELTSASGLRGLMVPKAEDSSQLTGVARRCPPGIQLIALIETARGLVNVDPIARCAEVARLAFGAVDFSLDINTADSAGPLLFARSVLVVASRAAGKPSPIDSPTTDLSAEAAAQDARVARSLGFGAKLCVHPAQVDAVKNAFKPTQRELDWARTIVAASSSTAGVAAVAGQMFDRPVIERAKRIIDLHERDESHASGA